MGRRGPQNVPTNRKEKSMIDELPPFSLEKLLDTVFKPKEGEKVCIMLDFERPREMMNGLHFLEIPGNAIQKLAFEEFYQGLHDGVAQKLGLTGGELYGYALTGGSNLDLPDEAYNAEGKEISLEKDVYPNYDIILCISTFSATAPLTAFCKQYGFRGATLHGLNPIILKTGLSVDYEEVSEQAEKMRLGLTKAEAIEINLNVNNGDKTKLRIQLDGQEAQKSHGLCRGEKPDVANLPAGEVYFVPDKVDGEFPLRFSDGTLCILAVTSGKVTGGRFIQGTEETLLAFLDKVKEDPMVGAIGELGFGTQELPISGQDIQDEKIFGTFHLATGRSDHLGGDITPDKFKDKRNASHEDILFALHKTPEIQIEEVILHKNGKQELLFKDDEPTPFLLSLR